MPKTSQLSNDLMTFKSCGQGFRLGSKKVPIMENLGGCGDSSTPLPPPFYPTVKETVDCDGSWALLWSHMESWNLVVEPVVSLDLLLEYEPRMRYLTGPGCDGILHSFITNCIVFSGQFGGSYRKDGCDLYKVIVSGPCMRHLTGPGRGGTYFCETSP